MLEITKYADLGMNWKNVKQRKAEKSNKSLMSLLLKSYDTEDKANQSHMFFLTPTLL